MVNAPRHLTECREDSVTFPIDWKESYFRLHLDTKLGAYRCPFCKGLFRGPKGFKELHGDHIYPRAAGGKTVWSNLQLLCKECNWKKSAKI